MCCQKQLNSWHGNIVFKIKRQPRLGLLCQLCVTSARKQGHNPWRLLIQPTPVYKNSWQRNKHQRFTPWWKTNLMVFDDGTKIRRSRLDDLIKPVDPFKLLLKVLGYKIDSFLRFPLKHNIIVVSKLCPRS